MQLAATKWCLNFMVTPCINNIQAESGLQSALNLHTVRLFTEGEAVVIQLVLLRMSGVLLETC